MPNSDGGLWFYLNDNLLELQSLTNAVTGAVSTGATVTAQIYTRKRSLLSTTVITLSHVSTSAGTYRGTIDDDFSTAVKPGSHLIGRVTADAGAQLKGVFEIPLHVVWRQTT